MAPKDQNPVCAANIPPASRQQEKPTAFLENLATRFVLLLSLVAVGLFLLSCMLTPGWTVEFHPHLRFYRLNRLETAGHAHQREIRRVSEVHFGPFALSSTDQRHRAQK